MEVTIDRPKANAIDSKTSIILGEIFSNFRDDDNLLVAILTGSGEKFFSASWDLKAVNEGEILPLDEILVKINQKYAGRVISISLKDSEKGLFG